MSKAYFKDDMNTDVAWLLEPSNHPLDKDEVEVFIARLLLSVPVISEDSFTPEELGL